MRRNAILLAVGLLLSQSHKLQAQTASNAASFLEIDAGARAAGMGGAFTAIADDASSIFYNPAGPALMRNQEVMLSHSQWLGGLWNDQIAYIQPVSDKLTFFTGVAVLAGPPLDKLDIDGDKTGSFIAFDGALGAGAAWAFGGDLYGGVNLKTICQQVDNGRALAYAGDVGFIKQSNRLRIGASVQNVGTKMKLYQESFDLPLIYRAGAAFHILDKYWLSGESVKIGKGDAALAVGAEGEFNLTRTEVGYLRAGYRGGRSKNTGSGVSGGIGFKTGPLYVDYAFSPFGDLGDTHRLTLGFRFGNDRDDINRRKTKAPAYTRNEPAREPEVESPASAQVQPEEEVAEAVVERPVVAAPVVKRTYREYLKSASGHISRKDYRRAELEYGRALKALAENDGRRVYIYEQLGEVALKLKAAARAKNYYLAAIQTAKRSSVASHQLGPSTVPPIRTHLFRLFSSLTL